MNKQDYKKAFSVLHTTVNAEEIRRKSHKRYPRPLLPILVLALAGCMTTGYFIYNKGKSISVKIEETKETYVYKGDNISIEIYKYSVDENGQVYKLSKQEALYNNELAGDVEIDDHHVYIYMFDQKYDVTEYVSEGKCYVIIPHNKIEIYFSITDINYDDISACWCVYKKDPHEGHQYHHVGI